MREAESSGRYPVNRVERKEHLENFQGKRATSGNRRPARNNRLLHPQVRDRDLDELFADGRVAELFIERHDGLSGVKDEAGESAIRKCPFDLFDEPSPVALTLKTLGDRHLAQPCAMVRKRQRDDAADKVALGVEQAEVQLAAPLFQVFIRQAQAERLSQNLVAQGNSRRKSAEP